MCRNVDHRVNDLSLCCKTGPKSFSSLFVAFELQIFVKYNNLNKNSSCSVFPKHTNPAHILIACKLTSYTQVYNFATYLNWINLARQAKLFQKTSRKIRSRPCENPLADLCTSENSKNQYSLLKKQKQKTDGQVFQKYRSAKVR